VQGIKDDQVAKAKGLGVIGLMFVVAATVHYWPRADRAEPVKGLEPAIVAAAPRAAAPSAVPSTRIPERPFGVVRPPALRTGAPEQIPAVRPDALPLVPLTSLPGAPSDRPEPLRTASFVPTLAPPLAPPPAPIVETQPTRIAQSSGALTVAAKATGKGLAVAFQKTGAAFRRVF
jgi:hypothetical protein